MSYWEKSMKNSITVFGVRLADQRVHRTCGVFQSMEHAQDSINDLIKACTGEDKLWVNPPDEVWLLLGWPSLSSKVGDREWTKGIRVYPPTSLRYR